MLRSREAHNPPGAVAECAGAASASLSSDFPSQWSRDRSERVGAAAKLAQGREAEQQAAGGPEQVSGQSSTRGVDSAPRRLRSAYVAAAQKALEDLEAVEGVEQFVSVAERALSSLEPDTGALDPRLLLAWSDLGPALWMASPGPWDGLRLAKLLALLDTPGAVQQIPESILTDLDAGEDALAALLDAAWDTCLVEPMHGGRRTSARLRTAHGQASAQMDTSAPTSTAEASEASSRDPGPPLEPKASLTTTESGSASVTGSEAAVGPDLGSVDDERTEDERRLDLLAVASLDLLRVSWKLADKLLEAVSMGELVRRAEPMESWPVKLLDPPQRKPWTGLPPLPRTEWVHDVEAVPAPPMPERHSRPVAPTAGYSDVFLRPFWLRFELLRPISALLTPPTASDQHAAARYFKSIRRPTTASVEPLARAAGRTPAEQVVHMDRLLSDLRICPAPFLRQAVVRAAERVVAAGGEERVDPETRWEWELRAVAPDVAAVFQAARAAGASLAARQRALARFLALPKQGPLP